MFSSVIVSKLRGRVMNVVFALYIVLRGIPLYVLGVWPLGDRVDMVMFGVFINVYLKVGGCQMVRCVIVANLAISRLLGVPSARHTLSSSVVRAYVCTWLYNLASCIVAKATAWLTSCLAFVCSLF